MDAHGRWDARPGPSPSSAVPPTDISTPVRWLDWVIFLGLASALVLVLLSRPHSPPYMKLALGWTATVAGAVEAPRLIGADYVLAFAPAALAIAMLAALRWPVQTLLVAFLLPGVFGTLEAFTFIEAGQLADLALGGAWLALVYSWLSGRRQPPAVVPPAMLLFGAYIAVTLLFALLNDDLTRSLYSFRSSAWLMTAVFLVPLLGE